MPSSDSLARVVAFGESHLFPLIWAYEAQKKQGIPPVDFRTINFFDARYQPKKQQIGTEVVYNPVILEDVQALMAERPPNFLVATVGGAEHFILGALNSPRPFDVVIPDRPELPVTPAAEIVPYDMVRSELRRRTLDGMGVKSLIRSVQSLCDRPIYYLCPPPPVSRAEALAAHIPPEWDSLVRKHGIAPAPFRYRLWRVLIDALQEICEELNLHLLGPPPECFDAGGFLKEEFKLDGYHGNHAYGDLVIAQLASLASAGACQ
jgi:hypothetical protein